MPPEEIMSLGSYRLSQKNFTCVSSNKTFSSIFNLNQRMTIHSGEKFYVCEVCNKSFGRRFDLLRHIRIHSNAEPFEHNGFSQLSSPKEFFS